MNININEWKLCSLCGDANMIAVGEEIGKNWESIYIYECPKCHTMVRTTIKYLKSFVKKSDREVVKFT
jgi:hypothetical protein